MAGSPGSARRQVAGSLRKPAKSGAFILPARWRLQIWNRPSRSFFSPARLADKRPSRPASCQSPPPKAVPALGIYPASGSTSFFILKLRSMGHNAVSFQDYRGQFRVRKLKTRMIRATLKVRLASSDLSPQRCSGQVLDPALTARCALIASTKSKRLTRTAASSALSELLHYPCHSSW